MENFGIEKKYLDHDCETGRDSLWFYLHLLSKFHNITLKFEKHIVLNCVIV